MGDRGAFHERRWSRPSFTVGGSANKGGYSKGQPHLLVMRYSTAGIAAVRKLIGWNSNAWVLFFWILCSLNKEVPLMMSLTSSAYMGTVRVL